MSNTDTEGDPSREFARALFGTDEPDEPDEPDDDKQKPLGNFVPLEGNTPKTQDNSDGELIRILFDN
jgi:hypothetical protein